MSRKKNQKVFKHILTNPFQAHWPEISKEQSQQLITILHRESINQAISGIKIDLKIQKTSEANLESFVKSNLILGINKSIQNIEKISKVILFKCEANEVLIEPLFLLCRAKGIVCITCSFETVYEKIYELTGIPKLAALALPIENVFPQTEILLNSLGPKNLRPYAQVAIKSMEIVNK